MGDSKVKSHWLEVHSQICVSLRVPDLKRQETLFSDLTAQMSQLADRLQNRNPVASTEEGV